MLFRVLCATAALLMLPASIATAEDGAPAEAILVLDGSRLVSGETCFRMTRGGALMGFQRETVSEAPSILGPAWQIVSAQILPERNFRFVDTFLLTRDALRPVAFNSVLNGREIARLSYLNGRIFGLRYDRASNALRAIDIPAPEGVLDANLWGPTLTASMLSGAAQYRPANFHYNSGLGQFVINVTGEESVETAEGARAAWALDMGFAPDSLTRYVVAKDNGDILSARSGDFAVERLPDCTGVPE